MELTKKKCIPCEAGTLPLREEDIKELLEHISAWTINKGHLNKNFNFKNFIEAMKFVNSIADVAEKLGHHPDFSVHYNKVHIEIWTHAINGLSENDFILAAKIDTIK